MRLSLVVRLLLLACSWQALGSSGAVAADDAAGRSSELQGSTYLGRNRKVVGTTVLVRPEADPSRLVVTSSDGKGIFRVGALPDGEYRVEVSRDGLEPVVKSAVAVRYPFRAVVEVPMRPRQAAVASSDAPSGSASTPEPLTLRGRVVDAGDQPVADIPLRFSRRDGGEDPHLLQSGEDGSFELVGLSSGAWRLEVRAVGFLPIRTDLELLADTSLRISLVRQPADYAPTPLDLMPPEQPLPPRGLDAPPVF